MGILPYVSTKEETMCVKLAHVLSTQEGFSGVKCEEPMLRVRQLSSSPKFATYWLCTD